MTHYHRGVTKRERRNKPSKPEAANVEFQTILRIRPLQKKEKEDHIVLEAAVDKTVAVLHPMAHLTSPDLSMKRSSGNLSNPKFIQQERQEQFHFHKILDSNSSQDNVYYSIGLNMSTNAMEPLKKSSHASHVCNHVVLSMGVSNSGKTHTSFGSLKAMGRPGRHEEDGLVPRIIESCFSQSKHHVNAKKSFAVRMTLLHVENDKVHDLFVEPAAAAAQKEYATPPSSKKKAGVMAMVANFERSSTKKASEEVRIDQDPATHDYVPDATVKTCWTAADAKELLQSGLTRGLSSKFAGLAKGNSRGHTLVTIQPVIIQGSRRDSTAVERCGGTIAFLDMAGAERVKKSRGMRDGVATSNSSSAAVMHCLRGIKHNCDVLSGKDCGDEETSDDSEICSEISCVSEPKVPKRRQTKPVPYRQSKVTMLLQPLLSQTAEWISEKSKTKTVVTTLLAAYPGHRDYVEKRSLLNDFEMLLGSDMAKKATHTPDAGLEMHLTSLKESGESLEETHEEYEETSSLESDEDEAPQKTVELPFRSPPVMPSAPAVDGGDIPLAVDDVQEPLPPPYAPHSKIYSEVQNDRAVNDVHSTPVDCSAVPTRTCIEDLPGVKLPSKPSPAVQNFHRKADVAQQHTKRTPRVASVAKAGPSPSDANPPYKAAPMRASISPIPNIQPPARKANASTNEKTSIRKDKSPAKIAARAAHSSKKKTRKEKAERALERSVSKRMSNEFEPKDDSAMVHRVTKLERENSELKVQNTRLIERCEELMAENENLQREVREHKVKLRRENWTSQDEQEWQHSKRLRRDEQRLIRSPLWEHLENVQSTDEIHSSWINTGKQSFSLQFPNNWKRAPDLDQRDRALEGTMATMATAPSIDTTTSDNNQQKRERVSSLQRRLNKKSNKKNKNR